MLVNALKRDREFTSPAVLNAQLHMAAAEGRLDVVEALIDKPQLIGMVDVNSQLALHEESSHDGSPTALFRACHHRHGDTSWNAAEQLKIVCKLLDSGADVDLEKTSMFTPHIALQIALEGCSSITHPDCTIVHELLHRGARCFGAIELATVLNNMCRSISTSTSTSTSTSNGTSTNNSNSNSNSGSYEPNGEQLLLELVAALLQNDADPNGPKDDDGNGDIMADALCEGDWPALVELLLAFGGEIKDGARHLMDAETPHLHLAAGATYTPNSRYGRRVRGCDSEQFVQRHMQTVRLLLQHGADINVVKRPPPWSRGYTAGYEADNFYGTALHSAYKASNFDVAAQLERAGARSIKDRKKRLPRDYIDQDKYKAFLQQRWERRKSFVLVLRSVGLAGAVGAAGTGAAEGAGVRKEPVVRAVAVRAVQRIIASYL
ncbi:hypothetical protein B484DRAFT_457114 [Ochromonadaceae sp. CCMP2298]|nr:hypothetical protein B484DRAFT_457114 [Ochromonadaceae sp. CCMP2298]